MQKGPWVPELKCSAIIIHKKSPQLLILLCTYVMAKRSVCPGVREIKKSG